MGSKKKRLDVRLFLGVVWILSVVVLGYAWVVGLLVKQYPDYGVEEILLSLEAAHVMGWILLLIGVGVMALAILSHQKHTAQSRAAILELMRRLIAGHTQQEAVLTQISENLLLSDAVKSVAFREKDRTVLEEAIGHDIRTEKWESAELLITDLASRFGCQKEAMALRLDMERYRKATIEEKIDAAIQRLESLWSIHHYVDAEQQVETLMKLYPRHERVRRLENQTELRREGHKKELLSRWDRAIKNNRIDESIDVLKLLDNYLSPTEAAALEESARGVFRAKLHNMGVNFSLFVTEKNWDKALKVGKEIIDEFPNSRMAQEVHDKLAILEERAGVSPASGK